MKSGGQAKATRPVSWLSPPPPCQRKALVALWCSSGVWRTWNMSTAMFPLERSIIQIPAWRESVWCHVGWSPLSQVTLSYENRWMYQAPSQTAASKCQPWCTQKVFPNLHEQTCEVVSLFRGSYQVVHLFSFFFVLYVLLPCHKKNKGALIVRTVYSTIIFWLFCLFVFFYTEI